MKTTFVLLVLSVLLATAPVRQIHAAPEHTLPPPDGASRVIDRDTEADVNDVSMFVTNQGSWAFDMTTGGPGLEWPQGSDKHTVYAAGLWLGARVGNEIRVTVGEYSQEYAAGPLDAGGLPIDPNELDPAHHVYKINRGDGPSNPDWVNWPVAYGAPVDPVGDPLVIGDQTLWCVYNDAVASKHSSNSGSTTPLGVEVRQTAFAFDHQGPLGNTVFMHFEVENKGPNHLEQMYMSLWLDPDVGGSTDDLAGCDTTLGLGYCYNGDGDDTQYGAHAPAVGCLLLRGPVVGNETLGMTAFNVYINGTDPASAIESYNYMQGLDATGQPQTCLGDPTTFVLSGDPIAGTGCVDETPLDKRIMLTTGPLEMLPGDTQELLVAVIVGGVFEDGDHLANVALLESYCNAARDAHARGFQDVNDFPVCDAGGPYTGLTGGPIQFDGAGSFDPDGAIVSYTWEFGDGWTAGGVTTSHAYSTGGDYWVTLTVVDDLGAESYCLARATIESATPVELSSFEATDACDGIILGWTTRAEHDLLGFHLWRSDEAGARYVRITGAPVRGTSPYRYVDATPEVGHTCFYRLEAIDLAGGVEFFGPVRGTVLPARVLRLALRQNAPNPFNPSTTIGFELSRPASCSLTIFDTAGRAVRALSAGTLPAGNHEVRWNGLDDRGTAVASGIYFYELRVGDQSRVRKMSLMR